ncbi:bifunctional diaminohydroxyphosphoribosylaminopyrimidine deaminase/5-amino-6-(5-phosphoribosylamino)uracil reductase RibD [Oscillibacter sp. GMB15532]|uniref:bifunctional diaminohydroxyphosphoribosylaminopyrimidine deaminase/5-amino-6-(5-phosphoribosylamino)uracil reductase RibD n=1 Tax=Oscillibacter sp. GMB15532 TaxID=3230022 RepID=UPI0034E0193E
MEDTQFMRMALELAQRGCGRTNPNPIVGAVIVKDGRVIGQGYHDHYGGLHAERAALQSCTESPRGAVLYVTLEPCCHFGRQPPCTDAILEAGIERIVVGSSDPNPLASGRGVKQLRSGGVQVETGILQAECDALNPMFFHFIRAGTPYVTMKYAMTMDGKIATRTGVSRWITGEAARQRVHADRGRYAAIMAGVGTVLADDPLLTCRSEGGRNPLRVICDTHFRIPLESQIVRTAPSVPTVIAAGNGSNEKKKQLEAAGCRVWELPTSAGHVDLRALMKRLGDKKIDSVLLEGGGTLNWAALEAGIVQKVQAYIAPKLFGGAAKTPVGGLGAALPEQAFLLKNTSVTALGEDFLLESEVAYDVHGNC